MPSFLPSNQGTFVQISEHALFMHSFFLLNTNTINVLMGWALSMYGAASDSGPALI